MSIAAAQRYSAAQRCPICGGYSTGARGTAAHCFGYLSTDGQYAHCTRTEPAGDLDRHPGSDTFPHRMVGPCRCGQTHGAQATWEKPHVNGNGRKIVATYDYRTAGGDLAYQAVRYEPKDFRQRRPDKAAESGWDWHLADTPRVLYRLPELLAAPKDEPVWIAEGEKDVETLRGLGMVATCNVMGKGKWLPQYGEHLAGRTVLILYDRDKDQGGYRHAQDIKVKLSGYATKAAIIDLPNDAHDVTDWITVQGGSVDELRRMAHEVLHPPPPIRILTYDQLDALPDLDFLYQDMVPEQSLFTVIGEQAKGKTFTTLHMCFSLACIGRQIVYIVGEGSRGIRQRARAWSRYFNNGESIPNMFFIPEPIVPTIAEMMDKLRTSMDMAGCPNPSGILFDTLAMCFEGNDNAPEEMNAFVRATKRLGMETGAAIGIIHHTGWEGTRMAGNRKLQNAADVEMFVSQDEASGIISVECRKMRDGEKFRTRTFKLERVPGTGSCVVVPTEERPNPTAGLPERHLVIVTTLHSAGRKGMGFMELSRTVGQARKNTLSDDLQKLTKSRHIAAIGTSGTTDRRYFHPDFCPEGITSNDTGLLPKDTGITGNSPFKTVTGDTGSYGEQGNQNDGEQDNEAGRGLVRNETETLRNEGERPVTSCKGCGRWMWTQIGREDGSWYCSNCGVDYRKE